MDDLWGVYVHVPWCRRRCPYCDFFFEVGSAKPCFGTQIVREYEHRRHLWPDDRPATLYFGGGTPSLLDQESLSTIVSQIDLESNAEVTLEANPEDVNHETTKGWKSEGINRVSLGIQSFDDNILKKLGRKHRTKDAWNAISACQEAGIDRISVDLICGVPGEDPQMIMKVVEQLAASGIGHISAYLLTVEEGTSLQKRIEKGLAEPVDEENQAQIYEDLQIVMGAAGYRQYEVSSYARVGEESKHNRNYWGKGSYLGLGPSAHSMRLLPDGGVLREQNARSMNRWQEARESETLAPGHAFLEAVAFGLRDLVVGVDLSKFALRHRCTVPSGVLEVLASSERKGWTKQDGQHVKLTNLGVRFSDAIARDILSS